MDVVKISRKQLTELGIPPSFDTRVYFHPLRIVGDIFWLRFEKMLEMAEPDGSGTALDLGCGHGLFLPSLSKHYKRVVGIDIKTYGETDAILEKFNCRNVEVFEMDGGKTGFGDKTFDAVFAADVLEHFRDLEKPIREIHRILKPGGKLLINSPIESGFFSLIRSLAGFNKPADHYHSAEEISRGISELFKISQKYNFPPLFGKFRILEIIKAEKV